jgi:hypothetical protein
MASTTACKPITIAKVLRPGESVKSNSGRSGWAGRGAGGVKREADGYVARFAAIRRGVIVAVDVGETIGAGVAVGTATAVVDSGAGVAVGRGVSVGLGVDVSVGCEVAVGVGNGVPIKAGAGVPVAVGVVFTVAVASTVSVGKVVGVATGPRSETLKVRENFVPRPRSSLYSTVIVFWPDALES